MRIKSPSGDWIYSISIPDGGKSKIQVFVNPHKFYGSGVNRKKGLQLISEMGTKKDLHLINSRF